MSLILKSLRRALLAATILACPAPLYAQTPPPSKAESSGTMEIFSPTANWQVESGRIDLPQGQSMPYCAISNTYRDSGRLEFYGTAGNLAAIKVDIPGQTFSEGQVLDVGITMPGGYGSTVKASVAGTSTLILNVKGDEALTAALHNGTLLYVGVEGREYPFSLSGINRFGERMRTCTQFARTLRPGGVSPPLASAPVKEDELKAAQPAVQEEKAPDDESLRGAEKTATPVLEPEQAGKPAFDVNAKPAVVSALDQDFRPSPSGAPAPVSAVSEKTQEQGVKEQAAKEQVARALAEKKLAETERELAAAREQAAKGQAAGELAAAKERAARELAEKELAAKEQELAAQKKQMAEREQAIKALTAKGQAEKTARQTENAENEALKVLMAPAKSDPAMPVQHMPGAAQQAVPEPSPAQLSAPSFNPAEPEVPRGKVIARIGEEKTSSSQAGLDALFTSARPAEASKAMLLVQTSPAPARVRKPVSPQDSPSAAQPSAVAVAKVTSVPPQPQGQFSSEPPPVWRALKGSSLREVLALWSLDKNVELIWDAGEQYRVKETVNLKSSYESAVETLLRQYESGLFSASVRRPVGQLYVDPAKGTRVLVIRSQTG